MEYNESLNIMLNILLKVSYGALVWCIGLLGQLMSSDMEHGSNMYSMTRNWSNQNPDPDLKTKTGSN